MKREREKITIELDKAEAYVLRNLARAYKKTLEELIVELCKDHINDVMKFMEEEMDKTSQNLKMPT